MHEQMSFCHKVLLPWEFHSSLAAFFQVKGPKVFPNMDLPAGK